jgi:cell division septation protein DedD
MSPREEEEFELVLGNKQLLSLFFLVVVLFGVFFSFGYTVGYSRGETSRTRDVASAEPVEEPSKKVQLPEALLQDAPKPATPSTSAKSEPAASAPAKQDSPPPITPAPKTAPPPSIAQTTPAAEAPKPRPVPETTRPAAAPPPKTSAAAKTSPAAPKTTAPAKASAPAKVSGSAPSAQAVAASTHIQVAAVRVQKDAEVYVEQLRAKGHPAALSDQGDGWYRVVVGPFNGMPDAEAYQKRLQAEGVQNTMIRKR